MGFVLLPPFAQSFAIKSSTQEIAQQCWQEFEILQFTSPTSDFTAFIEQGKHYFNDAANSHWRTAGLLYYYSFMNLAKGYLILKSKQTHQNLTSKKVYHGLSVKTQLPVDIASFEVDISPLQASGAVNLFAELYEAVVGSGWPFQSNITIKTADILPYCADIGDEVERLYNIRTMLGFVQSLIRTSGVPINIAWFEAVTDAATASRMQQIPGWALQVITLEQLTYEDKFELLLALKRTALSLSSKTILRGNQTSKMQEKQSLVAEVHHETCKNLNGYAQPVVYWDDDRPGWYFVPKIQIQGTSMPWHPMLSDYLLSFVLSSIVRYSPHVVRPSTKDFLLANAWCAQSPGTTLRYFLSLSTNPPIMVRRLS